MFDSKISRFTILRRYRRPISRCSSCGALGWVRQSGQRQHRPIGARAAAITAMNAAGGSHSVSRAACRPCAVPASYHAGGCHLESDPRLEIDASLQPGPEPAGLGRHGARCYAPRSLARFAGPALRRAGLGRAHGGAVTGLAWARSELATVAEYEFAIRVGNPSR